MLLLFLLIPSYKFKSKKEKYKWFIISVLSGVMSFVIWSVLIKMLLGVDNISTDTNSMDQLKFILTSPFEYIQILINTFIVNLKFYLIGFIGNLGWLDTNFPYLFILMYFMILIVTVLFDNSRSKAIIDIKNKGLTTSIGILIILLMETALYITWTSKSEIGGVGFEIVSGVQGRYFIPISIILLILLKINITKYNEKFDKFSNMITFLIPKISIFSLTYTMFILLLRYWIPSP
jgi:uncharacterized membrane protein